MKLKSVYDPEFAPYGTALDIDVKELIEALEKNTERPENRIMYIPSDPKLESLAVFEEFRDKVYGGMPIQIGYCNGANTKLNGLEWHRGAEVCVPADDLVLLLGKMEYLKDNKFDTSKVEAFLIPRGVAALCYETSLHLAPAKKDGPFRAVIVLPRDTNTAAPRNHDLLLKAKNKWMILHPDLPWADPKTSVLGLIGKNIDIMTDLD